MFDRLIESEPEGAEFKDRRSYFMVSSLVVGVLFATAVVISIYAADVGLGNSTFELTEMLAPNEVAPPEPETPERQRTQTQTQVATRQVNMARVDEPPKDIPTAISTTPNTQKARPKYDEWIVGSKFDSDPIGGQSSGRITGGTPTAGSGLSTQNPVAVVEKDVEPPPAIKRDPAPSKPVSIGVVNGKASYLPKPVYSAAAISVRAEGRVDVQVTIDETGRVVSANAVSGHPLLRANAEQAARNARFTPTLLSKVPVKVTGVITYNFVR